MEPNSPKKIQFAVPLFQSQIDPEAAEQVRKKRTLMTLLGLCLLQIRKRRPTPASLVIMNEHKTLPVPVSYCLSLCFVPPQSQSASPKQRKQSVFTPPALKG
ncbi:PPR1C phosphatase, partial [Spizaetus tyrannus]|nr:PPR1C phosphatase [Spizaetus tyrannus]NXW14716.1 PPR1C phosphatase [Circaetus pectoralis]